ncbi:MAG TPA: GtrA family protein [Rhizomicrobium sp.]
MTLAERVRASRFLRFAIVGAGGFVVDEAVLALLTRVLGVDPFSARVASILAAMTFTWWGNRSLTFRDHAAIGVSAMAREWLLFVAANSVGAFVNYGSYALLVRFAPAPLNNTFLAVAAGVAIGLVFNFTLSKRLVFRAPG